MAVKAVLRTTTPDVAARSAEATQASFATSVLSLLSMNGRPSSNPEYVTRNKFLPCLAGISILEPHEQIAGIMLPFAVIVSLAEAHGVPDEHHACALDLRRLAEHLDRGRRADRRGLASDERTAMAPRTCDNATKLSRYLIEQTLDADPELRIRKRRPSAW
jgi:hypothetical protein